MLVVRLFRRIIIREEYSLGGVAMAQTVHSSSAAIAAYDAVSMVLSSFGPRDIVSTGTTVQAVRWLEPTCRETDEELVAMIVFVAISKTMGVSFDHKQKQKQKRA
jgi:ABC-type phosphate/phosphonate transport system permease subunit